MELSAVKAAVQLTVNPVVRRARAMWYGCDDKFIRPSPKCSHKCEPIVHVRRMGLSAFSGKLCQTLQNIATVWDEGRSHNTTKTELKSVRTELPTASQLSDLTYKSFSEVRNNSSHSRPVLVLKNWSWDLRLPQDSTKHIYVKNRFPFFTDFKERILSQNMEFLQRIVYFGFRER